MNEQEARQAVEVTGSSLAKEYIRESEQDSADPWSKWEDAQGLVDDFQAYRQAKKMMGYKETIDDRSKENLQQLVHVHTVLLSHEMKMHILKNGNDRDTIALSETWSKEVGKAVQYILKRSGPLHDDDAYWYGLCDAITDYIYRRVCRIIENMEV